MKPKKPLSWKPVRRGNIYCAPACGGRCTWAAYQSAKNAAEKVRKQMKGSGWYVRLTENLGWHWSVDRDYISVYPSITNRNTVSYHCLVSDTPNGPGGLAIWSTRKSSSDPNRAVMYEVNRAKEVVGHFNKVLDAITRL